MVLQSDNLQIPCRNFAQPMKRKIVSILLLLLTGWILTDLLLPRQGNFRSFDPTAVARLDAGMWRSYYDRKPLALLWQSAELLRKQVHAPFWRSFLLAYHAAHAAFIFKDGKTRADYIRALPPLEQFYGGIAQLGTKPMDEKRAARNELEWWIIRRERDQHPPAEWAALQAQIAADLYRIPVASCQKYGDLRTQAMLYRDTRNTTMTEADWKQVEQLLRQSWQSLSQAVR